MQSFIFEHIKWSTKSYNDLSKDELYDLLQLRSIVFVNEQGVEPGSYIDIDGVDRHCWHLLAYYNGKLIAYLRVIPAKSGTNEGSIGRVVVAKEYRNYGLGHMLINRGIEVYNTFVGKSYPIVIPAQTQLVKFYSSHGFVPIGESFICDGLPHTMMKLIQ